MESFSDDFFDEFAQDVKKDNRSKGLWIIIRWFVRFRYDNRGGHFEVIQPMSQIDAGISNIYDVRKTGIVFDNVFLMAPSQPVWSR